MLPFRPLLTEANLNPKLVKAEYAVRGELVARAEEIAKQLEQKESKSKFPFHQIIPCNIGNPQDLGQKPITFFRQVLALCHYPAMLHDPALSAAFPADAKARALKYLNSVRGGTGAYTASQGMQVVREEVARFIAERDGFASSAGDIYLTDGASSAVKMALQAIITDERDGVMVPIPQYPLYSASLTLLGGSFVGYELDEPHGWGLSTAGLEKAFQDAKAKGVTPRALVVINPGNPTGQVLTEANMREVVEFCAKNNVVLLADEVYQTNIYGSTPFTSFKKVVRSMGPKFDNLELISFHSTSKGFLGECGQRGGYMELAGIHPSVKAQLTKLASISLCSNTSGQIMVGLMTNPPKAGEPSYELYHKESQGQIESLKRRAVKLAAALGKMEGITCNPIEGSMYAFPQITLPPKAVAAAKAAGKAPDTFFCLELLEATGIVVVPGSGFGQRAGTYHFRTTILPPEGQMDEVVKRFGDFFAAFLAKYK